MKPLRIALKLPRYCHRKPLKNGRWAYFFEPPTWARKQECPLEAEALGQNYDAAVSRAENVLLPADAQPVWPCRAGSKQVGDFTKAFVDAAYAKLLVVESLDADGNVARRERRRMAIAAMGRADALGL